MKAAILDDEPRGSKLLHQKLQPFKDNLEVVSVFNDPKEALEKINQLAIDVLFLDVEMPGYNGFQFLEKLGEFNFEVIFTTAYNTYTLDALRLSAVDYLLKPIAEDELQNAIQRLQKRVIKKTTYPIEDQHKLFNRNKLALPTAEGVHLINKAHIIRIEALSNYSTFILSPHKKIMVSRTLKEYELLLTGQEFIRVNRSTIINLNHVVKYRRGDGGCVELIDGFEVEVSPNKKEELLARLF